MCHTISISRDDANFQVEGAHNWSGGPHDFYEKKMDSVDSLHGAM